jgi:hypothetical protein
MKVCGLHVMNAFELRWRLGFDFVSNASVIVDY